MIIQLFAAFVGLSEGVVVGSALVALLTLLDIVPRLAQLTNTEGYMQFYERVIIISVTLISLGNFLNISLGISNLIVGILGFSMGVFVGSLAAALAEVTNVIPVMLSRFKLNQYIKYIFFSLVSGKVVGSLIYWIIINK